MNLFTVITIDFQLFLKKILGLLQALTIQVAFNSLFINDLNQDFSLLVKRTKMDGKLSTPDLVDLVYQFSLTLDKYLTSTHTSQSLNPVNEGPQMKSELIHFLVFLQKKTGHWESTYYKFKHVRNLQPFNQLLQCSSNT